jgi:allophanate hydrolase subunit 2
VCGSERETVKHYLLSCPRFAAQRTNLLTSAALQVYCGQEWQVGSDNEKVTFMLKGSTQLSYKENCALFSIVQRYILDTCRFS